MKKIFISVLLLCLMMLSLCQTVFANSYTADLPNIENNSDSNIISSVNADTLEKTPSVSAQTAVLYCVNTNEVLFGKSENKKMKMASTTKVMTALLCLEQSLSYNKEVAFTKEMQAEGSSMYLKVGDKVTLKDLAVGMLLPSGNDAANAAALTISGSTEKFAQLMNGRAKQIGMQNTNFVTPSGLDDDNHYSTAYDMALLLAYAMENESFSQITSQKNIKVDFVSPQDKSNTYSNHNRLLSVYDKCIGGKTGFTKAAGRCLVSAAKIDGLMLIAVTLNAPSDWDDHVKMFDYGFSQRTSVKCDDTDKTFNVAVAGSGTDSVKAGVNDISYVITTPDQCNNIVKFVYLPQFTYAPVKKGDKIGEIIYMINGNKVAQAHITAKEDANKKEENKSFWNIIKGLFSND